MISNLFKQPKPKKFNSRPRHYDSKKEERGKRKKSALKERELLQTDEGKKIVHERRSYAEQWQKEGDNRAKQANLMRIVMILGISILGFYFIFSSGIIDKMVQSFLK